MKQVKIEALTHEAFAPFGQFYTMANDCTVVDLGDDEQFEIVK